MTTAIGQFIRRAREADTPRAEYLDATTHPALSMALEAMDHAPMGGFMAAQGEKLVAKYGGERASFYAELLVKAVQDARRRGV